MQLQARRISAASQRFSPPGWRRPCEFGSSLMWFLSCLCPAGAAVRCDQDVQDPQGFPHRAVAQVGAPFRTDIKAEMWLLSSRGQRTASDRATRVPFSAVRQGWPRDHRLRAEGDAVLGARAHVGGHLGAPAVVRRRSGFRLLPLLRVPPPPLLLMTFFFPALSAG